MLNKLKEDLQEVANPEKAKILQRFFKTGSGQYGEGDIFLGIRVPIQRDIAKKYDLDLNEIQELLDSKIHEYRLVGLLILINKYKKGHGKEIFDFYLANTRNINNWDLVDLSAPNIIGDLLANWEYGNVHENLLFHLAKSDNLWEKRIAIVSTFAFVRKDQFENTLKIAEILLNDSHDLIHKAVGWMLREIGKRNLETLEKFLIKHYKNMPRTMLRYAIEKFDEEKRQKYLKGEI